MKRAFLWIGVIGLVIFLGFTFFTFSTIYKQVDMITKKAKTEFAGDSVESLISLINSNSHRYEEKNTANWALGQYADPKALPFLEKHNSQTVDKSICNRNNSLCKKEIKRAIKWCNKGNWTSWMYRNIK